MIYDLIVRFHAPEPDHPTMRALLERVQVLNTTGDREVHALRLAELLRLADHVGAEATRGVILPTAVTLEIPDKAYTPKPAKARRSA